MKKIYFSGSIRGGREDVAMYRAMIDRLSRRAEVLTEHIGSASLTADGQTVLTDREIYLRDTAWVEQCDLVIAECTQPSLGVGYELAYAEQLNKPVYVLFRDTGTRRLSAMIGGNPYLTVITYAVLDDILGWLDSLIAA